MVFDILIVDDSVTTRMMIKRALRMAAFDEGQIYEASDGLAALNVLTAYKVDLVLADLNMPRMDGVEMIRRMDADPALAKIPVIVISAEPNVASLASASRGGLRGHIRKPFTPEQIKQSITQTMGVPCAH